MGIKIEKIKKVFIVILTVLIAMLVIYALYANKSRFYNPEQQLIILVSFYPK